MKFARSHPEVALSERGAVATRRGGVQGQWYAVISSEPMTEGIHYAEFTIVRKHFGVFVGVVRPGWDVELCDVAGVHNAATASLYGHCLYYSLTGKSWPDNTAWDGMQASREGDRIGLLLDLDQGSLTVYKNGAWLGVLRAVGLSGEYCWAASLGAGQDSVHIESKPRPERTHEQLAVTSAAALSHAHRQAEAAERAASDVERIQQELALLNVEEHDELISAEALLSSGRSRAERKDDAERAAARAVHEAKQSAKALAMQEKQRQPSYYRDGKKLVALERTKSMKLMGS